MRTATLSVFFIASLASVGCNRAATPTELHAASASAQAGTPGFVTTLELKQVMNWVVDPNARIVFAAVGSIVTEHGEEQLAPKTDEEWNSIRNSAATVLESGNLLMLQGRAKDQKEWIARAKAMSDAAAATLQAIDVKDPEALFTASGDLYQTCSDCHAQYIFAAAPPAAKSGS